MAEQLEQNSGKQVTVEFIYLNTNEETKFLVSWEDTLAQVWEQAYDKLGEVHREKDELECQNGESLMSYLNLTLIELHERRICQERKFQIKSETGGA